MLGDDLAAALPELRAHAESMMIDRVVVKRRTGWDEIGGRRVPALTTVYTGMAGLGRSGVQPNDAAANIGQQLAVQEQIVKFPIGSYRPQSGDLVEFTAESQAHLVGVQMRLTGSAPTTSYPVQYRMFAERIV